MQGSGGPLQTDYGPAAFTNVANAEVRQYQIDLAVEAVGLGFDEILYDYVRRPEGDIGGDVLPRSAGRPRRRRRPLRRRRPTPSWPTPTPCSASRCSASPPPGRSRSPRTSVCSPPTSTTSRRWSTRRTGVPASTTSPIRCGSPPTSSGPASPTSRAVVAGSGAAVVPWLQDFSAGGVVYGPVEVRAQIDAALAAGASGFLLWNSGSFYTAAALQPPPVP